jgi:ribosomal protein S18 acetylase RimI-like enzyme
MEISLRAALPGDFEFARRTYYDTMRWIIERLFGWDEAREDAKFARYFDIGAVRIITVDGRDAGWIQTQPGEGAINLVSLYVAPPLQRQGVGTTILKRLLAEAESQDRAVTLSVVKFNPAIGLYERHGFQIVHEDEYKYYMRRAR